MEAFVYCWTDWKENKLYVGSHKGSPDDGYICSQRKEGGMLKEYEKRPDDFTRQIVASGTLDDMRNFEKVLLQAEKVMTNEHYYNMNDSPAPPILRGKDHPWSNPINRANHAKAMKNKKHGKLPWEGGKRSAESVQKMIDNHWSKTRPEEYLESKRGENNPNYKDGAWTKENIKETRRAYYLEYHRKRKMKNADI